MFTLALTCTKDEFQQKPGKGMVVSKIWSSSMGFENRWLRRGKKHNSVLLSSKEVMAGQTQRPSPLSGLQPASQLLGSPNSTDILLNKPWLSSPLLLEQQAGCSSCQQGSISSRILSTLYWLLLSAWSPLWRLDSYDKWWLSGPAGRAWMCTYHWALHGAYP